MAESTPTNAPAKGTAPVADIVQSEDFLNSIMDDMAKGTEPVQRIVRQEPQPQAEPEPKPAPQAEPEPEPEPDTTPSEPAPEATPETAPQPAEVLEKRLKDSQSMIGRQANELGQLRKQVQDLQKGFEASRQQTGNNQEPYYEKLVKASDDDVANLLMQEAQKHGEQMDPIFARQQARALKTTAQMQLDIVRDATKPLAEFAQQSKQQAETARKDADWYQQHPDAEARKQLMNQFITESYPDGLQVTDEAGNVVGYKADPYEVAHQAYVYAGIVSKGAVKTTTDANNKRVVNARSFEAAATGATPRPQGQQPQKKVDAKQSEIDRVFALQESALIRAVRG